MLTFMRNYAKLTVSAQRHLGWTRSNSTEYCPPSLTSDLNRLCEEQNPFFPLSLAENRLLLESFARASQHTAVMRSKVRQAIFSQAILPCRFY